MDKQEVLDFFETEVNNSFKTYIRNESFESYFSYENVQRKLDKINEVKKYLEDNLK